MPATIQNVTLYSVPELASMLNVTTVSIRNYIKQGYLKGQKMTGRWFVAEDDVKKFFENLD